MMLELKCTMMGKIKKLPYTVVKKKTPKNASFSVKFPQDRNEYVKFQAGAWSRKRAFSYLNVFVKKNSFRKRTTASRPPTFTKEADACIVTPADLTCIAGKKIFIDVTLAKWAELKSLKERTWKLEENTVVEKQARKKKTQRNELPPPFFFL